MAYRAGEIQEVVQTREDSIYTRFVLDHDEQTPTSATVTIYGPSPEDEKVASVVATVTASIVSYTRTWESATFELCEGYRADWAITYGGVVYTQRTWFDVALQKFIIGLTDDDMTSIDQAVRTNQIPSGSDFSAFRHSAMRELRGRLRGELQKSPGYITRPELFFQAALYLALSNYFWAIFKMEGDAYHTKALQYKKKSDSEYRIALSYLPVDYTEDKGLGQQRRRRFQNAGR